MNLVSAATKLYNQCFQRIDDRPGKMPLSTAFATKLHHDRISGRTESKLLTIFNATLFQTTECTSSQACVRATEKELSIAVTAVRSMSASKAKSSLLNIISVMTERLNEAKTTPTSALPPLASHQGTLVDAVRQHHHTRITQQIEEQIGAFAHERYGMLERPADVREAKECLKHRKDNDCVDLGEARRELEQATAELSGIPVGHTHWRLKLVLDQIETEIENENVHWRRMSHAAYANYQPPVVALLATNILGKESSTTQLIKHFQPELLQQQSDDGSDSDTPSETWSAATHFQQTPNMDAQPQP